MNENWTSGSRRWFVKVGAATSSALALGSSDTVAAQENGPSDDDQPDWRQGLMFFTGFYENAVFRVVSPALDDAPAMDDPDAVADRSVRVIEYFNTNQEEYLFVPQDADLTEGELYRLDDQFITDENGTVDAGLAEVQYRPLDIEDFQFDLEEGDEFDIVDEGGGEAAVRPRNFFTNGLFRITSGPQGWIPEDVEQSGYFTDYNTVHAEYLGVNDEFLFFPQETAEFEEGSVYVLWDEFELFDPAGNLVATEFDRVDEESITVPDDIL